jgi:hypothetical protein
MEWNNIFDFGKLRFICTTRHQRIINGLNDLKRRWNSLHTNFNFRRLQCILCYLIIHALDLIEAS